MYVKGSGFKDYSGKSYENIRRLREGKHIQDNKKRQQALIANKHLIQNFKSVPIGIPYNLKVIYRGVDLSHAKTYGKDIMYIESKSYLSFSKIKLTAASFPKVANKIHGILVLNTQIIPRRTPVIYNRMWGMKSSQEQEEEVLLPPGILIFSTIPTSNRTYNKRYYNVIQYKPFPLKPIH